MAGLSQFASLDSTALESEPSEPQQRPRSFARRSVSIFSRKGTETPEPQPTSFAPAAMQTPKSKLWIRRKSVETNSVPKPRGTILNAVPPAKTIQMTPLEEEMATSPNEEILCAINRSPVIEPAFEWPTPSSEQIEVLWNTSTVPLAQRTISKRRKHASTRIGVWRNGVAHWDDVVPPERAAWEEPTSQEVTGFSTLQRYSTETLSHPRPTRPMLSVVIPKSEPIISDATISPNIVDPMLRRSMDSIAPAIMLSRSISSRTKRTTSGTYEDVVSPLESPSSWRHTPPLMRPGAPTRQNIIPSKPAGGRGSRKSSSSTLSSSLQHDEDSDDSRGSSVTSIDILDSTAPSKKRMPKSPVSSPTSPTVHHPFHEHTATVSGNLEHPTPSSLIPPLPTRAPPVPPCVLVETSYTPPVARTSQGLQGAEVLLLSDCRSSSNALRLFDFADERPRHDGAEEIPTGICSVRQSENGAEKQVLMSRDGDQPTPQLDGNVRNLPTGGQHVLVHSSSLRRNGSVHSVLHPPERAPTIPKRSRKREWRVSRDTNNAVQLSLRTARRRKSESKPHRGWTEQANMRGLRRCPSATEIAIVSDVAILARTPIESLLPPKPKIVIDSGLNGVYSSVNAASALEGDVIVARTAAEDVLLNILASLDDTKDLYNAATINKGMYRVFKENEMDLIRRVTYNQSSAAWELREWCPPRDCTRPETEELRAPLQDSAESYTSAYSDDMRVIESLKELILERCQTIIRRETVIAISTPTHPSAQRFTDAFWRIWCFCKIFGCGKGREEDVTGQLDWLKGGLLANNQDLTATTNVNLDFEMTSVLLNAPEHFAKGNGGGLSARQLYDMTEIWTCMRTLLEGFIGRTEQAWDHGIFDGCLVGHGGDMTEEELLEDWIAHLLTRGTDVVLSMAQFANDTSSAGFAHAKANGWTLWNPPEFNGSRSAFLKEPVSRLYEERVAATALNLWNPLVEEEKEMSRKRVATLAAEIKLARQSSCFKRLPYTDMDKERPMSVCSRNSSTISGRSVGIVSSISSVPHQRSTASKRATVPGSDTQAPNFSVLHPKSPPFSLWSPRRISPIIEDRVETFNRMSLRNFGSGDANDTAERAVQKIVSMGFSASQACEALRKTDLGDGLRVDRAVDMLLRAR